MENFDCFICKPLPIVKKDLEELGYKVVVTKNSLTKIKTDYELVVSIRKLKEKELELIVGDFLINIENKIN